MSWFFLGDIVRGGWRLKVGPKGSSCVGRQARIERGKKKRMGHGFAGGIFLDADMGFSRTIRRFFFSFRSSRQICFFQEKRAIVPAENPTRPEPSSPQEQADSMMCFSPINNNILSRLPVGTLSAINRKNRWLNRR